MACLVQQCRAAIHEELHGSKQQVTFFSHMASLSTANSLLSLMLIYSKISRHSFDTDAWATAGV